MQPWRLANHTYSTYLFEEWQVLDRPEREHVQQVRSELVDVAQVHLQKRLSLAMPLKELHTKYTIART